MYICAQTQQDVTRVCVQPQQDVGYSSSIRKVCLLQEFLGPTFIDRKD